MTRTKQAAQKVKKHTKQYVKNVMSPTPKWAVWCRNLSAVCAGLGGGLKMYPEVFPDFVLNYQTHIIAIGVMAAIIFQSFKKQQS